MKNNRGEIDFDVIINAQSGHEGSLSALSEHVRDKILVYIYRLTLDYHLTEDLAQDTIVEILKSLKRLNIENQAGFWAWTYRTALSKVQHHFRLQGNRRIKQKTIVDKDIVEQISSNRDIHGPENLMRQEMVTAVIDAMDALKLEHRSVLALRCMDEMSYAQIARIIGGTELRARLLFVRAKRSLKRRLNRRNFNSKYMLTALGIFSYVTAKTTNTAQAGPLSKAAISAGAQANIIAAATSKLGFACIFAILVAVFWLNGLVPQFGPPAPRWDGTIGNQSWTPSVSGPSALVDSNDPDSSGWQSVDVFLPNPAFYSTPPEEMLINRKSDPNILILPKDHWVELQFDGPVLDGTGVDIFMMGKTDGNLPDVFLADSSGRKLKITPTSYQDMDMGVRYMGYDIAGYNMPFEADRIRVSGTDNASPYGGYALHHVRARIKHSLLE
jgi:RNA polymerase sigma-70 factor (ECF subfamily)